MAITDPEKRILQAARKVFVEYGFVGARMQRIADEAGISKASLHYYFRSKEKLFDRIFAEYMDRVMPLLNTWNDDSDDWESKVRLFVRQLTTIYGDTSLHFMVQELRRDPAKLISRLEKKKRGRNRFITYYERLMADGLVREQDPRALAITMHAVCAYPQLNAPMMGAALRMNNKGYEAYLKNEYTEQATELLIRLMKK
ncbi:MAG: TetR/AcrR family transcriptional regulator [Flavobacteriales bacterium]|nr:TetR/AcrR family transcriptional regulator [Flavobacteriales bacterium]MCB9193236.1 TetR/AcrR family transcriptional regulator [Flavobacteriales bacterium]